MYRSIHTRAYQGSDLDSAGGAVDLSPCSSQPCMTTLHRERDRRRGRGQGRQRQKRGEMNEIGKCFEIVRGRSRAYFGVKEKDTVKDPNSPNNGLMVRR